MASTKRPKFDVAWKLFTKVRGDGSLAHLATLIGGKVKANVDAGTFKNGCAIRLSYVLNYSGISLSDAKGKTVSGGDDRRYLFRVTDILPFLVDTFGPSDMTVDSPTASSFAAKRGFLVFEVNVWSDARGHATLWDGKIANDCSDHCYFAEAHRAHLWILP